MPDKRCHIQCWGGCREPRKYHTPTIHSPSNLRNMSTVLNFRNIFGLWKESHKIFKLSGLFSIIPSHIHLKTGVVTSAWQRSFPSFRRTNKGFLIKEVNLSPSADMKINSTCQIFRENKAPFLIHNKYFWKLLFRQKTAQVFYLPGWYWMGWCAVQI